MSEKEPPMQSDVIEEAKKKGDTKKLSNAGRRGALITNEIKAHKKMQRAEQAEHDKIDLMYIDILHKEGEEAADQWLREQGLYK